MLASRVANADDSAQQLQQTVFIQYGVLLRHDGSAMQHGCAHLPMQHPDPNLA